MTVNRYTKLIKTLKEAPTNRMGGVYSLNPAGYDLRKPDAPKKFYPSIDGTFPDGIPGNTGDPYYLRPAGFWDGGDDWESYQVSDGSQDYLLDDPTGKSTDGLIAEDGTVKASLPPNSRHFILGPLVDGYVENHGSDNFTNIGYLQKDTRQFVLLAIVQGQLTTDLHQAGARVWNGESSQIQFINSNFTLDMALWFRDNITNGSFTRNVPYFYSGGVPQQPISGGPNCPNCPPNMFGGIGAGTNGQFGSGGPGPTLGDGPNPNPESKSGNDQDAGGPFFGLFGGALDSLIDGLGDLGQYATNLLKALTNKFGTGIPALDYSTNIAKSILMNQPIEVNQADIPQSTIDKLAENIPDKAIGEDIKVTSEPIPYSDDNFYETPSGEIKTHTPQTLQQYPNNTAPVAYMSRAEMGMVGEGNPLAAAGKAQAQIVVPPDGGEPYLLYTDHAYANLESKDPKEFPDAIKKGISDLVHSVRHSEPPKSDRYGEGPGGGIDTTTPNTGGMAGYPPSIRGDVRTEVKVPLSKLSPKAQAQVKFVTDNPIQYSENPIHQTKNESYKPKFLSNRKRQPISEGISNQKRILREIRKPVEIKEAPTKYKINFPKQDTSSSQTDELVGRANARGQQWRSDNKRWSGYETTEKDNIIQDRVGHGKLAFDYMIEQGTQKSEWRTREMQEELNLIAHEKAMLRENPDYKSPFGNVEVSTTDKNIKNFEKVNRLRQIVADKKVFSNKEIKPEYPTDPVPQPGEVHPKLQSGENTSARYKRLDPISAKSMPDTAYPQIDDFRDKARKKPK